MIIWTLFNSTIILILLSEGLVILNSSKNKLSTISAYFLLSSPSYTTLPLHSFSKGVDTCELLWSCMIALTLCMFYIGMWLKEMLLHITGSVMNKGGSHPTAILGFCKANNFTSGALQAFLPIYFGSSWELQLNQAKLFWKLPSPFSLIDLNWAAFWIEIRVYSSRHATYVDCCWYSFTQLIPQSKPTLKWYIFLSFTITVTIPLAPPSWEEFDICENFLIYTFSSPLDISATVTT